MFFSNHSCNNYKSGCQYPFIGSILLKTAFRGCEMQKALDGMIFHALTLSH